MPIYFQRPENALKRAQEFIDVGKKTSALDALYDVIKSRKHRTWQKVHEPIMKMYLELCVELKKSHVAKEGLFQYRIICQQVNIGSLEQVVKEYLALAEAKTEAARKESAQAVLETTMVDDLDQVATPENLLLSAVSSEGNQERSDRVLLTPWVKFLWESYRQCLELLRNNSRVERLYHDIAQAAFRFCVNYARKTEFRKLCDNLRGHLAHIHRFPQQATAINLQAVETQQMHLETRLTQLDMAIKMELWQEAYKAAEDIHAMMCLSKKSTKPQLMAVYYQRLALVFLKAGNGLFHASALLKHLNLVKDLKKSITGEELRRLAARAVLATLATPLPATRPEMDNLVETDEAVMDKNVRVLANLLGLANPPSRHTLVRDLHRLNIVSLAPTEVQKLYALLETDFDPLNLCAGVAKVFEFITNWSATAETGKEGGREGTAYPGDELTVYLKGLKAMMVCRLLREIAQVYESIAIKRVLELCPMIDAFELEAAVVDAVRRHSLQVRIDHKLQALHFGSDLSISQREETVDQGGPYLQAMPSDLIRSQLEKLYRVLRQSVDVIQPERIQLERKSLRQELHKAYLAGWKREQHKILERQSKIEKRKEELENKSLAREEAERLEEEKRQQRLREAEAARLAKEAQEREALRQTREDEERRKKMVAEKIEALKRTEFGAKMVESIEEQMLERMNTEDIQQIQLDHWTKERRELQQRMHKQERKIDHMERAKRLEEIPLLEEEFIRREEERRKLWDELERERVERAIAERYLAMEQKRRLSRMAEDKERFIQKLQAERYEEYKKLKQAFDAKLANEKAKRLAARKESRVEKRREEWRAEREQKRRVAEEAERRRLEEEERAAREAAEAKRREREREIEEKLAEEKKRELELEQERERERDQRAQAQATSGGGRSREAEGGSSGPQPWRRTGPVSDMSRETGRSRHSGGGASGPRTENSANSNWRLRSGATGTGPRRGDRERDEGKDLNRGAKTGPTDSGAAGSEQSWWRSGSGSQGQGRQDSKQDRGDRDRDGRRDNRAGLGPSSDASSENWRKT
ncbi:eukaryotic translation initiation factor 3 subunit A-like [Tropilaelaps mercedesae]|uniref:Eukaryotic translation initiation factor 3 subunit A n=1 Tax=Tropilaelaps mercedesae TaxID=418985 RepID=A0A1V9XQL7_9ACAR|nr:eukaryotic translation initiation factor 3 subunit A-like [Tropilaelaps mercedesae]